MSTGNRLRAAYLVLVMLSGCRWVEPEAKPPSASAPPLASPPAAGPFPTPTVGASALLHQESLYDVVTNEFVRQGWKFVCVGVAPRPVRQFGGTDLVDPPEGATAWLKSHNPRFRPASACRQDGEEVFERNSTADGGVFVTVWGADVEPRGTLVRVTWCCWTGWGTLVLAPAEDGWILVRTENWLQT